MNLLRFGTKLLLQKATRERIPFQINIHITDKCNLRCQYCYIDFDHAEKDMKIEDAKRILIEAQQAGAERISLEGGEPLIHNDIGAMVKLIKDLGMECNINTNGFFLPKRIKDVKRTDLLTISLDGPKEVHDEQRGEGSFEKAIAAIELARAEGIRVHIFSVLNKKNKGAIDCLLDIARKYKCYLAPTSIFVNTVMVSKGPEHVDKYMMSDEEYRQVLQELVDRKAAGAPIIWSEKNLKYIKSWPFSFMKSNFTPNDVPVGNHYTPIKCNAGMDFCVIQTNGDLYTCDPLLGLNPSPPNCIELGFKEALQRISIGDCQGCNSIVCSELNQLFSLDPSVVGNLVRNYGKTP